MERRAFLGLLVPAIQMCRNDGATVTCPPAAPPPVSPSQSLVSATSPITEDSGTSTITVTVKRTDASILEGATVTLSATGTGNTLGQPATPTNRYGQVTGTLSSTDPGTKVVTAVADGTTITQTASIVVSASGGGTLPQWEHQPSGMTTIRDEFWDLGNASFRATFDFVSGASRMSTQSGDSTCPYTGQLDPSHPAYRRFGRETIPIGDDGGFSSTRYEDSLALMGSGWATFWTGYHFRMSNPFDHHNTLILKTYEYWMSSSDNSQIQCNPSSASTTAPVAVGTVNQFGDADAFQGSGSFALGQWHKLEVLWTRSSRRTQVWCDGTLVNDRTDADMDLTTPMLFEFLMLRGGTGDASNITSTFDRDWVAMGYT